MDQLGDSVNLSQNNELCGSGIVSNEQESLRCCLDALKKAWLLLGLSYVTDFKLCLIRLTCS